jgi:hypothetical protein
MSTTTTYETSEQYRKMSTQIRDLQEELAKQKKENEAEVKRVSRFGYDRYCELIDELRRVRALLENEDEVEELAALRTLRDELYQRDPDDDLVLGPALKKELHDSKKGYERLKAELGALKSSNYVHYKGCEQLKAENAALKEQLRVKGAGVPFA